MTMPRTFRPRRAGARGFTMIELMVVIAIILVLIAMAAARYEQSVTRAREAVLKQDLQTMRSAIQQFTLDKQMAPQSLDDLVQAGYLTPDPGRSDHPHARMAPGLRRFCTKPGPKLRRHDRRARHLGRRLAFRPLGLQHLVAFFTAGAHPDAPCFAMASRSAKPPV